MIDSFVEKLKIEKGSILLLTENSLTLLIQTFDWRFCKGEKWDIKNSRSKTSFMGNTALKRDDFIRTKHPIYSFAVTGKYKNKLANLENIGSFDKNSPFHFMYKKKAKMIIIDIPLHGSFTFAHFVEEMEQVDYRYNNGFVSTYIDSQGEESIRSYDMFVRDLEKKLIVDHKPLEKLFIKNNVMEKYIVNKLHIIYVDLFEAYNLIKNDIRHNNSKSLCKLGVN